MTISTETSPKWLDMLDQFTPEQQRLLLWEAENLANMLKARNPFCRISTNGALEILFAIACVEQKGILHE